MSRVAIAVLAGGQSRRMGRPKALLPLGHATLVERVFAAAWPLSAERLLIAPDRAPFAHLGLPVHPDLRPGLGPLGGLYTALRLCAAPAVLLLACDLPFLTTPFLRFLLAQRDPSCQAVVPRTQDGLQPLCALYERICEPAVTLALDQGHLSMHQLLDELDLRLLEPPEWQPFDPHGLLLANLNTPEEYARACHFVDRPAF